jgi:hypothetical protein
MVDYAKLKDELVNDPESYGYSGMTPAEVVASLRVVNRTRPRASLTGSEVFNAVVKGEYNVLPEPDQGSVWDVLHLGTINPFGIEADLFADIFGPQSQTITNLKAIRVEAISREVELGLGRVGVGTVEFVRSQI